MLLLLHLELLAGGGFEKQRLGRADKFAPSRRPITHRLSILRQGGIRIGKAMRSAAMTKETALSPAPPKPWAEAALAVSIIRQSPVILPASPSMRLFMPMKSATKALDARAIDILRLAALPGYGPRS